VVVYRTTAGEPERGPKPEPGRERGRATRTPERENGGRSLASYGPLVTVTRIVDGDTVEVSPPVRGISEARLLLVDTPESRDPSEGVEPLGLEASAFTERELEGERVAVQLDALT
jgi:micrococcal nuclease